MSMKKWSKKIAMLVLSFGMLIGSSATAFAFVPDDVNSEVATETVQEESVAETQQQITILTIWSLTIQQQATTCICCPLLTKMI